MLDHRSEPRHRIRRRPHSRPHGRESQFCARDRASLKRPPSELQREGICVFAEPADVSDARQVAAFVEATEKALGPVEILVNNAGIGYFGPYDEATEATWDSVLDTNLKSVFLVSKEIAPGMI